VGNDLCHCHGTAALRAPHPPGGATSGPGWSGSGRGRCRRFTLEAAWPGVEAHRQAGDLQLRHLLPLAERCGLPASGRCSGCCRWAAATLRRHLVLADRRPPAANARSRDRMRRGDGGGAGRDPSWSQPRPGRSARGSRCQPLVRVRRGTDQAVPGAIEQDCGDRLAIVDGRSGLAAARVHRGRCTSSSERTQPCRVRLPQHGWHGVRVHRLVQRRTSPADSRTASARARRTRHRGDTRMGGSRPVAVAAASRWIRDHDRCHCLRSHIESECGGKVQR
jgi:hypothetical protein